MKVNIYIVRKKILLRKKEKNVIVQENDFPETKSEMVRLLEKNAFSFKIKAFIDVNEKN